MESTMSDPLKELPVPGDQTDYVLDLQIGFVLRRAWQRHAAIFAERMECDLTPTQFAVMAKLFEIGECSQNRLGRAVAIDAATVKGVVDRLVKRDYLQSRSDPDDGRRLLVSLTVEGRTIAERAIPCAKDITERTLEPLGEEGRKVLFDLLSKLT